MSKVLDIECPFETGSEEPAKRRNKRSETRHEEQMNLIRSVRDRRHRAPNQRRQEHPCRRRDLPVLPHENGVWFACDGDVECADAKVPDGTDHVVEAHEEGAPDDGEDDGAEKCADEPFDGLLWGEFDEGSAADGDSPDVGEDVVADDEGGGDPEPDHAFEDVVDDEVAIVSSERVHIKREKDQGRYLETTMSMRVMCTQQNKPNCCLRCPR